MQYRQLGKSGARVSVIGLGGNRLGLENKVPQPKVNEIIAAAQDVGINFIDTADAYTKGRSEESLGVALQGRWQHFFWQQNLKLPPVRVPMITVCHAPI